MKKVVLALGVIAMVSMTSCNKDKKVEEGATEATEQAEGTSEEGTEETASSIEVPEFSTPEMNEYAKEYAAYLEEVAEVTKSGDAEKIKELTAKAQDWATKSAEKLQGMTPEDRQKWSEWASKIAQEQAAAMQK